MRRELEQVLAVKENMQPDEKEALRKTRGEKTEEKKGKQQKGGKDAPTLPRWRQSEDAEEGKGGGAEEEEDIWTFNNQLHIYFCNQRVCVLALIFIVFCIVICKCHLQISQFRLQMKLSVMRPHVDRLLFCFLLGSSRCMRGVAAPLQRSISTPTLDRL